MQRCGPSSFGEGGISVHPLADFAGTFPKVAATAFTRFRVLSIQSSGEDELTLSGRLLPLGKSPKQFDEIHRRESAHSDAVLRLTDGAVTPRALSLPAHVAVTLTLAGILDATNASPKRLPSAATDANRMAIGAAELRGDATSIRSRSLLKAGKG